MVPVHDPVNKPTTQCTYHHIQCIFSAHTTAAITSSVHTLQQPLRLQCTHYSSHYIFSAHCNHVELCTAICSQSSVHNAANCNHVQLCTAICSQSSVHNAANCSHLQPPTLQLYHSVLTAATL